MYMSDYGNEKNGTARKQWAAHTSSSCSFGCDKGKAHWEAFISLLSLSIFLLLLIIIMIIYFFSFSHQCITHYVAWLERGVLFFYCSLAFLVALESVFEVFFLGVWDNKVSLSMCVFWFWFFFPSGNFCVCVGKGIRESWHDWLSLPCSCTITFR